MVTSSPNQGRQAGPGRFLDAGMLGGLLLALIAVQVVDRLQSAGGPVPAVDLVFLLDQSYSMKDLLGEIKASCLKKAESLKADGSDCRFAVIPFGPLRKRITTVPLTDDLDSFKKQLMTTPGPEETSKTTSGVAALEEALALDFRKDTPVLFFLISRAPCPEGADVAAVAARMAGRKVTTIVQADAAEKDRCRPLYQAGGRFFSMEGADLTGPVAETSKSDKPDKSDKSDKDPSAAAGNLLARLAPASRSADSSEVVKVTGIYSARNSPNRQQVVERMGGNQDSERAVADGLAWLARHQADNGSWSDPQKCEKGQPCERPIYGAAISETGLAILAFQAGGNYAFNEQKYSANVKRGLDWLVAQQTQDGCLFGGTGTWYQHGMGSFALAEACAVARAENEAPDPRYLDAARRAIQFIEKHQYAGGGWQYALDSGSLGDTSVSGWQVLALKSAQEAKIDVSADTIRRVQEFYESLGNPETGKTGYQGRGSGETDLTTAVGLIVQEFILKKPDSPLARKAVQYLKGQAATLGTSGDFYTLYNGTLALFLARGDAWKQWNRGVRDAVVKRQDKTGCARGSWTDPYGKTLDTSWAVLTLEIYYRYATEEAEATPKARPTGK